MITGLLGVSVAGHWRSTVGVHGALGATLFLVTGLFRGNKAFGIK